MTDCNQLLCSHGINDRKHWKMWALKNHPDKGGNEEDFKDVLNCVERGVYCPHQEPKFEETPKPKPKSKKTPKKPKPKKTPKPKSTRTSTKKRGINVPENAKWYTENLKRNRTLTYTMGPRCAIILKNKEGKLYRKTLQKFPNEQRQILEKAKQICQEEYKSRPKKRRSKKKAK
jgi:hypothetical protein